MAEDSLFWDGTSTGDAGPYYSDDFCQKFVAKALAQNGIYDLYVAELFGQIVLTEGTAIVDGTIYTNDNQETISVTTPGAGTNYYNVVLRKTWATQEVRYAVLGPDPATPPTPTQTNGVVYEYSIATIAVDSGGNKTITNNVRLLSRLNTAAYIFPSTVTEPIGGNNCIAAWAEWTGVAAGSGTLSGVTLYSQPSKPYYLPVVVATAMATGPITVTVDNLQDTGTDITCDFVWKAADASTYASVPIMYFASGTQHALGS